jgi:WD40 repeat protein
VASGLFLPDLFPLLKPSIAIYNMMLGVMAVKGVYQFNWRRALASNVLVFAENLGLAVFTALGAFAVPNGLTPYVTPTETPEPTPAASHRFLKSPDITMLDSAPAFSPDGRLLAIEATDKNNNPKIVLWDMAAGTPLTPVAPGARAAAASQMNGKGVMLEFSPDANSHLLAEGSSDIVIWNVMTHQQVKRLNTPGKVIAFSPDGKLFASNNAEGGITLWDTTSWKPVGEPLRALTPPIHSLEFSPDGQRLASADEHNLCLWDATTHQPIGQPLPLETLDSPLRSVWFSLDGKQLFAYSGMNYLLTWDLETRPPTRRELATYLSPGAVAFGQQGMVFGRSDDSGTTVWSLKDDQHLEISFTWALALAFSPDGSVLAASRARYGEPVGIYLFDVGNPLHAPTVAASHHVFPHNRAIAFWSGAPAFSPDGRQVAVEGYNRTTKKFEIMLGDTATWTSTGLPMNLDFPFPMLCYSPDSSSKLLLAGGYGGLHGWNVETQKEMVNIPLDGEVASLAFSPDGKLLATSQTNNTEVTLWDTASW